MNQSVETRAKTGVAWSALASGATQFLSFVFGIFLARLLMPEDFGIFATIIIFTEVASSIITIGFMTALIQRKDIRADHYSTVFTAQVILAACLYLIILALSHFIGLFYHNELIGKVLAVTSLYLIILPFMCIPTTILQKRIDFRSTGVVDVVQQLSTGSSSVLLAYLGFGVWSIVYGKLFGYLIATLLLAYLVRWRPRLSFSVEAGRDIFGFSLKATVVHILNDTANNIDYAIVGRFLGPVQLGFYHRAYSLMTLPLTRIIFRVNTVFFSAFSEVQHDNAVLKTGILKSICYVSLLAFPMLTGLFWVAPAFIKLVYGLKWMETVLPLRIMCFAGMLLSIEPIAVSGIIAKGYVGLEVKRQLFYLIFLVISLSIGSHWGIAGISCAVLLASIFFMVLLQQLLKSLIGISWVELLQILCVPFIFCLIMSTVIYFVQSTFLHIIGAQSITMLSSNVILGILTYIFCFFGGRKILKNPLILEVFDEIDMYRKNAIGLLSRFIKRFGLAHE